MSDDSKDGCVTILVYAVVLALILIPVGLWSWYRAGVQVDIYKRQGIQITRWEVFIGAKPAESVIQIRQPEKP